MFRVSQEPLLCRPMEVQLHDQDTLVHIGMVQTLAAAVCGWYGVLQNPHTHDAATHSGPCPVETGMLLDRSEGHRKFIMSIRLMTRNTLNQEIPIQH